MTRTRTPPSTSARTRARRMLGGTVALVVAAVLGAALPTGGPPAEAARWRAPTFARSITGTGLAPLYAWGVQHNPVTDEVLVGDYFNYVVRRFDTDGHLVGTFGRGAGQRRGQPYSLAVDPRDGSIYVPELSDGQGFGWVAKYDARGRFLFEFRTGARYSAWIATDRQGHLYVADSHYWNNAASPPKIRKLRIHDATRSVTEVGSFGRFGRARGQLNMVRGIAVAGNGDIYVADGGNNVVTHFTNDGDHVRTLTGPFAGDLRGITLDEARGNLWVVDANGGQLERFDLATGRHTGTFGAGVGTGPGRFGDGGRQLDVTSRGDLWVADYGNFRVQRFTPSGAFAAAYPASADPAAGLVSQVRDVAVAPDGSVFVADVWNHRFQRFGPDGTFLGSWGRRGSDPPYGMNYPRGVGVDPRTGNLWVANTRDHQLRVYDHRQRHLFDVGTGRDSTEPGSFRWPLDVEFVGRTALVTDYVGHQLKRIRTEDGREIWSVRSRAVHGVAVDRKAKRVYAVGPARDRVFVHRLRDGKRLRSFGSSGTGPGQLSRPWDIDLVDGRLYVSDSERDKVLAFAKDGTFLGELGSSGDGPGQLDMPSGLAHDARGRLYVADTGNDRVQVFRFGRNAPGDGRAPEVRVATPADGGTVARGPVELTGTATDPDRVGAVMVSVEDLTAGQSWHASTSSWRTNGSWATAALSGADVTRQTFRWVLPTVAPGHRYAVRFRTTDGDGATATTPRLVRFTVS